MKTNTPEKMKHTTETALARAIALGYAGQYAQLQSQNWVGKTNDEIADDSEDFNQNYERRQKYARAAVIETNPSRKAHLEKQAGK